MFKSHLLLVSASLCFPAVASTPTETVAAFHEALASGKQAQAKALLSPTIQIYESGFVERSRDEYAGHHLPADADFAKTTKSTVLKTSERVNGELAVVLQETETTGKYKGVNVHLLGTETVVLEKKDDGWTIAHVHWSSRKSSK